MRLQARMQRDALASTDRMRWSASIAAAIYDHFVQALAPSAIVAVYAAKGSEVDLSWLCEKAASRGVRFAYPRVLRGSRVLEFALANAPHDFVAGAFGLTEPAPHTTVVALAEIAMFVVPALALDRAGRRLGWGKGYYDATLLQAANTPRIGAIFDSQWVPMIATAPHDQRMDAIVTQHEVVHLSQRMAGHDGSGCV